MRRIQRRKNPELGLQQPLHFGEYFVMAWDDQGNQGNKENKRDPWGNTDPKKNGPPDLDVLLGQLKRKISQLLSNKKPNLSGGDGFKAAPHATAGTGIFLTAIIVILIIIIWAISGIFIVSPAERAAITRFGKYVETVGPGPHWIPRLIDKRYIVNVQQVMPYTYSAEMLTKDENIVSVSVSVQYRVDNIRDYLFNVVNPNTSLQQATASAMRQVIGNTTLDQALTTGRSKVREEVAEQLRKILAPYQAGLEVTDVTLQPVKPPEQVTPAFDDAIKAREDQQSYINQAQAYAKQKIAEAEGQSARITQEADAYSKQVVLAAQAAVAQYLAVLPIFEQAPVVTRERMYLETMQSVFDHSSKILVDTKDGNNILYLPINKILSQQMSQSTATDAGNNVEKMANSAIKNNLSTNLANPYSIRPTSYPTRGAY